MSQEQFNLIPEYIRDQVIAPVDGFKCEKIKEMAAANVVKRIIYFQSQPKATKQRTLDLFLCLLEADPHILGQRTESLLTQITQQLLTNEQYQDVTGKSLKLLAKLADTNQEFAFKYFNEFVNSKFAEHQDS